MGGGYNLKLLSPACDARTVTVPAPVIVTELPAIVAGPDAMVNITGNPALAVALTVNGASPRVLFGIAVKLIVWFCFGFTKAKLWF